MTSPRGIDFRRSNGQWVITLGCEHQHGRLYVVEGAEMNWVETSMPLVSHSLAGFFSELDGLKDPQVKELMQRWGLYFRPLPLAEQSEESKEAQEAKGDQE